MKIAIPIILAVALSFLCGLSDAAQRTAQTNSPTGAGGRPPQIETATTQKIQMSVDGQEFEISLYDSPTVQALLNILPQTITVTRWGDGEYYGALGAKLPAEGEKQVFFDRGEVALWPEGNAFCIFFGKTPASSDDRPKMASPGIPIGKITRGDLAGFRSMGGKVTLALRQARSS